MGLREEIEPFKEGSGLIAPYPNREHQFRTCDNGVMYASEYYILLAKHGQLTEKDKEEYRDLMVSCMIEPGLVARAPGDRGDEAPDDYHGLFAGITVLGLKELGKEVLSYGLKHKGSFNPREPNKWTPESFLFRQPQLLAMAYCATGDIPFYARPLLWYSALIIVTGCLGTPPSDSDARRLGWHLIQAVKGFSWLCRQAEKVWTSRLFKDYPDGMRGVAKIYYSPGPPEHPFRKYFLT